MHRQVLLKIFKVILLLFAFSFAALVYAENYHVELLAFKHGNNSVETLVKAQDLAHYAKILQQNNYKVVGCAAWDKELLPNGRNNTLNFKKDSFSGTLTIKNFKTIFHINLDLFVTQNNRVVKLSHKARVKKNEVYYLDNPAYGVFLEIKAS